MGKIQDNFDAWKKSITRIIDECEIILLKNARMISDLESWEKEQVEQFEPLHLFFSSASKRFIVYIDDYRPDLLRELCHVVGAGYDIVVKLAENAERLTIHYQFKDKPVYAQMVHCPGPAPGDKCRIIREERPEINFALVCEN